jgi:hypothetical protein
VVTIDVTACQDNPQTDKSLALPGTVPAGDTDDNMPDVAVSTRLADSLECLMLRMGVTASEYAAGPVERGMSTPVASPPRVAPRSTNQWDPVTQCLVLGSTHRRRSDSSTRPR